MDRRKKLKSLAAERRAIIVPGTGNALFARVIEDLGFPVCYVSGAGIANMSLGAPDIGLCTLTEIAQVVSNIADVVDLPLIVDADTGYGGPLAAMRTTYLLERAGASAIQFEDQEAPKQCGHFDDHRLIPTEHMQAKLEAAISARSDPNLVIVARTDARSVYGIDEAIARSHAYAEAGADVLFVEAPRTVEELARVGRELAGKPLLINVVEGGKTPQLRVDEYASLGFSVVLYANFLMRTFIHAGRTALSHLHRHGETATVTDRMAGWDERQGLFRLPEFTAAQRYYDNPPVPADHTSVTSVNVDPGG